MKQILNKEFKVSKGIYYFDLISSSLLGWSLLISAVLFVSSSSLIFWLMLFVSALAHYRALSFLHEVAHQKDKITGLHALYNYLVGFWYGTPAYVDFPHTDHHSANTFGTEKDPEYVEWTERNPISIFRPFVFLFVAPLVINLRFCILPLFSVFLSENQKKNIFKRFSTFAMQANYSRELIPEEYELSKKEDLISSLFFLVKVIISITVLPYFIVFQLCVYAMIAFINSYRAMAAHRYQVSIRQLEASTALDSFQSQVMDSITVEGGILTELWAPLGLRYHSLHHLFPTLPYHSLGTAHFKLKKSLNADHFYFSTIESSFLGTIRKLYQNCLTRQRKQTSHV